MNVEVERFNLQIFFSQSPPPPQYDSLLRRSYAAGTGLDEPGVPHAVTQQTELKRVFPFQAGVDGFLHVDCISEQERTVSLQAGADVFLRAESTRIPEYDRGKIYHLKQTSG